MTDPTVQTRILYNDTCPVCRFEIDAYRKQAMAANVPLGFDTLEQAALWGVTPDQAARRLHVLHAGQLLSGIAAFRVVWSALPRWRWLAALTGLPILYPVACAAYDHVLAPLLYKAHLRRQARSTTPKE